MTVLEALTKLVVGMSRFGDHLLRQKVGGIIVAALAFACGAGLAHALRREPTATPAAPTFTSCGAPDLAEVSMRDTFEDEAEEEDAVFDKGQYENCVYGYSVRIPAGMVGLGSKPPAPQHGFGIDLDHPRSTAWVRGAEFPDSYVYVDGSYNSLEWERLDDAVNSHLSFLREKGRDVSVQVREEMRLGGLPAVGLMVFYEEDGVEMVSDEIVAFRREAGGEVSAVYTISLSTPRSKYERDRPALEALRDGWCLQPVE
jgi:hypothetical protein